MRSPKRALRACAVLVWLLVATDMLCTAAAMSGGRDEVGLLQPVSLHQALESAPTSSKWQRVEWMDVDPVLRATMMTLWGTEVAATASPTPNEGSSAILLEADATHDPAANGIDCKCQHVGSKTPEGLLNAAIVGRCSLFGSPAQPLPKCQCLGNDVSCPSGPVVFRLQNAPFFDVCAEARANPHPLLTSAPCLDPATGQDAKCGGGSGLSNHTALTMSQDTGSRVACSSQAMVEECENTQPCVVPVDCRTTLQICGACSATCGAGIMECTRRVIQPSQNGGKPCLPLLEVKNCSAATCPQDCQVGSWSQPGPCSVSCGDGVAEVHRNITQKPEHGGQACPPLKKLEPCNNGTCHQDCQFGPWSLWSPCSASCGNGTSTRQRSVDVAAQGGGQCDGPSAESRACSTGPCSQDCMVTAWSNYSACSVSCGGGTRRRYRNISQPRVGSGTSCPPLEAAEPCNTAPCAVDCQWTPWSQWSACSASCGNASTRVRIREVHRPAAHGGAPCEGSSSETEACSVPQCPRACEVSEYSTWSACSRSCGPGVMVRTRNITQQPVPQWVECPVLRQEAQCLLKPCPVDCVLGEWGEYDACGAAQNLSCGTASQSRHRSVVTQPSNGGAPCGDTTEQRSCELPECPCQMTTWSAFSACSVSCGNGTQQATRSILTPGPNCPSTTQTRTCGTQHCPVDCQVTDWGQWSACDVTCGSGVQTRRRDVIVNASYGGTACPVSLFQSRDCAPAPCAIDCMASEWGKWSPCSQSCGGGLQHRSRSIVREAAHGGRNNCTTLESRACGNQLCPQDCTWNNWSEWSQCTKTCGGGISTRHRSIQQQAANGGQPCAGTDTQTLTCGAQECPVDCQTSEWSQWSACSLSCGGGVVTRTRTVLRNASHHGVPCGETTQTIPCDASPCARNCVPGEWGAWGECGAYQDPRPTCGESLQRRTRPVAVPAVNGGRDCANLTETRPCTLAACPGECQVSDWSEWGQCSASCGGGVQYRDRTIVAAQGQDCGASRQSRACGEDACPVDCIASDWGSWSPCSTSCGGGLQYRNRSIARSAAHGGLPCAGPFVQQQACAEEACAVSCTVSSWSQWSQCSASCGPAVRSRVRDILTPPHNGGTDCPVLFETQDCNNTACECVAGPWGNWSQCIAGSQQRHRPVTSPGQQCPALVETRTCSMPCSWRSWQSWTTCSASCGGGQSTRTRQSTCDAVAPQRESQPCNTQPCGNATQPCHDHQWEDWSQWSPCHKPCGGGYQTRWKHHAASHCSSQQQGRSCNHHPCPQTIGQHVAKVFSTEVKLSDTSQYQLVTPRVKMSQKQT